MCRYPASSAGPWPSSADCSLAHPSPPPDLGWSKENKETWALSHPVFSSDAGWELVGPGPGPGAMEWPGLGPGIGTNPGEGFSLIKPQVGGGELMGAQPSLPRNGKVQPTANDTQRTREIVPCITGATKPTYSFVLNDLLVLASPEFVKVLRSLTENDPNVAELKIEIDGNPFLIKFTVHGTACTKLVVRRKTKKPHVNF